MCLTESCVYIYSTTEFGVSLHAQEYAMHQLYSTVVLRSTLAVTRCAASVKWWASNASRVESARKGASANILAWQPASDLHGRVNWWCQNTNFEKYKLEWHNRNSKLPYSGRKFLWIFASLFAVRENFIHKYWIAYKMWLKYENVIRKTHQCHRFAKMFTCEINPLYGIAHRCLLLSMLHCSLFTLPPYSVRTISQ